MRPRRDSEYQREEEDPSDSLANTDLQTKHDLSMSCEEEPLDRGAAAGAVCGCVGSVQGKESTTGESLRTTQ